MSDSLAISAVTVALQNLLDRGLERDVPGTDVTTRPLDKARTNVGNNQVNLFLYHTVPDPNWRNMDIPWRVRPGEMGRPPLALNLYYLVTAYYGENEDGTDTHSDPQRVLGSHRLLGRAMGVLHDHPVLDAETINAMLPPQDRMEHPYEQVDRVRITPYPLPLDDVSKLWAGFQTQYRLSAAYEVSVVLIESQRPPRRPLPVLKRGPEDQGVDTLLGPFPLLEEVRRPRGQRPGVQLGDDLVITGHNLGGEGLRIRFTHPHLADATELVPEIIEPMAQVQVKLPNDDAAQSTWAAGMYTLAAVVQKQGGDRESRSNDLPLVLAPRITIRPSSNGDLIFDRNPDGSVTLTLTCRPGVLPAQRVVLLLGEREVPAPPRPAQTGELIFEIDDAPMGLFRVRLRVDGADSLPVQWTKAGGLGFDPDQRVEIQ